MSYILEISCNDKGLENLLTIANEVLNRIQIFGPIIAIIAMIIIFIRMMSKPDDKKLLNNLKNTIIALLILFFVPLLVNVTMSLVDDSFEFSSCWNYVRTNDLEEANFIKDDSGKESQNLIDDPSEYDKGEKHKEPTKKSSSTAGKKVDIANMKNVVGICYSTWFNPIAGTAKLTSSSNKQPNVFYYWGEPALGFYRSDDKSVIKTHMQQLQSAKVDFIILDNTNAQTSWKNSGYWDQMITSSNTALLDTIYELNTKGRSTPKVVNWINTNNGNDVVNAIYNEFYTKDKYKNIWLYYNNKPFILTTTSTSSSNFTTRKMWGMQGSLATNEWSYLQQNNDKPAYNSSGQIEQIGVSVAAQQTYMSNTATAIGRRGGETFYNQWQTAFKYHPKVVTLTWWNEWAAQYINGNFTDEYNREYSRDIEPMKGGHGAKYYEMMKKYISAYKSNKSCPHLTE